MVAPVGFIRDAGGQRVLALVPVEPVGQIPGGGAPVMPGPEAAEALLGLRLAPGYSMEAAAFGNPIRVARLQAGVTQEDLAIVLGISQTMVSRQEKEGRALRPLTVQRALKAIARIQENRSRPAVNLDEVLGRLRPAMEAGIRLKPRDPVERRLLREAGDPVALQEDDARVRAGGERCKPPVGWRARR